MTLCEQLRGSCEAYVSSVWGRARRVGGEGFMCTARASRPFHVFWLPFRELGQCRGRGKGEGGVGGRVGGGGGRGGERGRGEGGSLVQEKGVCVCVCVFSSIPVTETDSPTLSSQ